MKRNTIAGAAALLTALCAAPALAAGASSQSDVVFFGKDPGDGKAYACFARHYDAVHLASHPKQNVRDMLLFVSSAVEPEMGRTYALEMGVTFKSMTTEFRVSGGCSSSVDGNALSCGIDCDGGEIDVEVRDAGSLMVSVPDGARTWDPESNVEPPEDARFGADDKLFRLDRTDLADCLPLVADDDVKAEIAKTQ
jgi:hypothetical protein